MSRIHNILTLYKWNNTLSWNAGNDLLTDKYSSDLKSQLYSNKSLKSHMVSSYIYNAS